MSGPTLASVPAQALGAEEIMQAARGKPPAGSVEVLSLRTATSKHYRLPDGTMQAVISEAPVHFEAGDGSWADIDATLIPEFIPGRYATRSTAYDLSVGREAVQQAPAQIGRDGWRVGIDLVSATEGEAFVLGRTACFPGVLDGVDLVYEAQGDGLKETLVLDSSDAESLFTFVLDTEGVSLEQDSLGGLDAP